MSTSIVQFRRGDRLDLSDDGSERRFGHEQTGISALRGLTQATPVFLAASVSIFTKESEYDRRVKVLRLLSDVIEGVEISHPSLRLSRTFGRNSHEKTE